MHILTSTKYNYNHHRTDSYSYESSSPLWVDWGDHLPLYKHSMPPINLLQTALLFCKLSDTHSTLKK